MKKRLPALIALLAAAVLIFTGCGARSGKTNYAGMSDSAPAMAKSQAGAQKTASAEVASNGKESGSTDAVGITSSVSSLRSASDYILANRKIIRKANVTVEVDNFDEAYGKINTIITGIGFIQESNINTSRRYIDSKEKLYKNGVIIVRVDKDKFESTLSNIKGIGVVLSENIGAEEVTDKYYDIESRLRLLKYEQERLETYLKSLNDLDKIFKTESRLTEIRHEIENLTINLNKLNDLVELATITININEKMPDVIPKGAVTYGDRLLGDLWSSIKGVVKFCGELLILIVRLLPVLIMLGLFAAAGILIYRKIAKARNSRKNNGSGPPPPTQC